MLVNIDDCRAEPKVHYQVYDRKAANRQETLLLATYGHPEGWDAVLETKDYTRQQADLVFFSGWRVYMSVETEPNSEIGPVVAQQVPQPRSAMASWIRDLLVALAIAAFIIIFLYQPVKVEGTSMMPGLTDQERIFINKFVYRFESISRGDIVVFHNPQDPSTSFIKRVIGVAGDRIQIDDGRVYVNGRLLTEPYIPEQFRDYVSSPELIVPPKTYFVLGDHRNMSWDSRKFGPVEEKHIYGKAVFVYWPVEKMGALR